VTIPVLIHATKQILDNWGSEGWELVQIAPGANPGNLVAEIKIAQYRFIFEPTKFSAIIHLKQIPNN
jgi:hypothetical protein